jgi:glyoxylate/succinic semialdehyde reductase
MKLAVNMVMGEMLCALGEGIHLADRSALNPATLIEILGLGAMACPLVTGKGPAMAAGGPFATAFPLKHQLKDVSCANSAAPCFVCLTLNHAVSARHPAKFRRVNH